MKINMNVKSFWHSLFTKQNIYKFILSLVIFISFVISLIFFLSKSSARRVFIFPSVDNGEYIVEYRNLAKNPVQGDINLYIDEILLGSQIERTKKLFVTGTKVISCFERDNVLYLNLSDDLLKADNSVVDIKTGVQLLDKNVKKNFPKIKKIDFFIDGKIAFEN